jgi:hypothetical protein
VLHRHWREPRIPGSGTPAVPARALWLWAARPASAPTASTHWYMTKSY